MNAGAAGFAGCPVSKLVLAASISSSVAVQAVQGFHRRPPSYLRFLAQSFVFRRPGELACGTLLLYYFRLFERRRGSAKQGAFVVSSLALNYAVQTAASAALSAALPTGPYGLIFASFIPYMSDVPPAQRFSLFGLPLTDKAFVYTAGLQLLLSSSWRSAAAGSCGLLVGLAYQYNFLGLKQLKIPRIVQSWCSSIFSPLLGSSQPRRQVLPRQPPSRQGRAAAAHSPAQASAPALPAASPEAIEQLVAMGFDQGRAANALQRSHNDIQTALTMLL